MLAATQKVLGVWVHTFKEEDMSFVESVRRTRPSSGISTIVIGKRTILVTTGRANKVVYGVHKLIKTVKDFVASHFDDKYTDYNWGGESFVVQLFRHSYGGDFDSYSEFAIIWSPNGTDEVNRLLSWGWEGGCSCEHDCCGHWFTNVWTHKTKSFWNFHLVFFGHAMNV